jgi:hypothetical protein
VKRSRGRGRRPQGSHNQHSHNRSFDSAGPDIKIRGTAANVYEKYLQLARDAGSAGDRVMQENYLQHAEHYYRILMAQGGPVAQPQQQPYQGQQPQPNGNGEVRPVQQGEGGFPPPASSAPSFSLTDADAGEEGDELT